MEALTILGYFFIFGIIAVEIAIFVFIVILIIKIIRAFLSIAESQREISLKLGKLNAILATKSFRDTGAGAGQSSEPATAPEQ